jgi:hypothetical protein
MIKFYGLGLATAIVAVVLELIVGIFMPPGDTLIGAFCQAFIVAASVEEICKFGFLFLGIKLDSAKNEVKGEEEKISTDDSSIAVYVIPTNEELVIARETLNLI